MEEHIKKLRNAKAIAVLGGGGQKIAKEHERGKLSARERIENLLDPGSFSEFNMLVKLASGAPGDGIVTGHGTIDGRTVCVFSPTSSIIFAP